MEFTSAIFIDTTRVEGWGTVITPAGSGSALRVFNKTIDRVPGSPIETIGTDLDFNTADGVSGAINIEDGWVFYRHRTTMGQSTSTKNPPIEILSFSLEPNYPNPFTTQTTIAFSLQEREIVQLRILDMSGRMVEEITTQEFTAGTHQIEWSPRETINQLYILEMQVGNKYQRRKLVQQK